MLNHPIRRDHFRIVAAAIIVCTPAALMTSALAAPSATPAGAASAAASTGVSPISIAPGCSYKTMATGLGFGNLTLNTGHGYNFFTIRFTNNAAVAANRIVFQVDFGKASRIAIPDVGTFAPGATTTTTFRDRGKEMVFSARPTPNDGSVICTVLSAQFADGTAYTAPLIPVASPAP